MGRDAKITGQRNTANTLLGKNEESSLSTTKNQDGSCGQIRQTWEPQRYVQQD